MSTPTHEHAAPADHSPERPERKEPTYLFTEKHVAEKSEIARRFLESRTRLNATVDKASNFLVKRFYNIDHNTYLKARCRPRRKS